MSERIIVALPDTYPFDFSRIVGLENFPAEQLKRLEDKANTVVGAILEDSGVETAKDVSAMPTNNWGKLRHDLLNVNISLKDGVAVHE